MNELDISLKLSKDKYPLLSTIKENELNDFALKIFGQRATFSEQAFPFNESYLREYMERSNLYNSYPSLNKKEINLLKQHYNVTHFLIRDSKILGYSKNSYSWKGGNLVLFEIDKFFELM